jgi:hypothetical protein
MIDWDLVELVAEVLGVPYFTYKKWRQRNHVPYKWRLDLILASKGKITADDFIVHDKRKLERAA